MRAIFTTLFLVSFLLAPLGVAQPVQAAPAPPFAVVAVPTLNVRAAPSTNAPVVGQVAKGERVTVLGRNGEGTWLRIESADGESGWVFAELTLPSVPLTALSVYQPVSQTQAASPAGESQSRSQPVAYRPSQAAASPASPSAAPGQNSAASPATDVNQLPRPNEDPKPLGPTRPVTEDRAQAASAAEPVALQPLCVPNKLRSVNVGGRPQSIAASGDRIYVALANLNTLMVVDSGMDVMLGSSRTTAKEIDGVTATMDALYISDPVKERLIVTSRQGAVKRQIDLPAAPGPVAVTQGRAFVLHPQMGAVSVVDLNSGDVLHTLSIGPDPRQLAVVGGRAFIAHAAGYLSVVDGFGRRQEQLLLPVNDVTGMAVDAESGTLFISSAADLKVVAVDVSTWTLANTWQLDLMPSSLVYNPITDHIFVLDSTSQYLTVLKGSDPSFRGRVRVSQQAAQDSGHSLALLQSKIYIVNPSQDFLDVWLDRTCASETMQRISQTGQTAQVRTDLAPRQVEARIGILWPHGGADPAQASFANLTATLLREDGASPACSWEPNVTLWAAIGTEPAKPVAQGKRRIMEENGIRYPVYDFNDVDVRATRERNVPIHFFVQVEGIQTAVNVWTHAGTGQFVPTVRPELEGLVTRYDGDLDARLWVEDGAEGPTVYAMLLRAGTMLGLAPGANTAKPQLRWALDNGVTEPELIIGEPEIRQDGGVVYTVWRFPGSNPDKLLRSAAQVRFWVEVPDVQVYSSVVAWGRDIRTLGARLPVPVVGCSE